MPGYKCIIKCGACPFGGFPLKVLSPPGRKGFRAFPVRSGVHPGGRFNPSRKYNSVLKAALV